MRLFPKLKLTPKIARMAYPRLMSLAYRFVDLEAESSASDSRVIEYSFVISRLVEAPKGKVLDVGCTDSGNIIPLCLASLGWDVYGIDNREFRFEHPNFRFVREDIRSASFPDGFFDYILAVSTIEHIGLKGRYRVTEDDPEGDIRAVREIQRILSPRGTFLVTLPYGKGQLVKPLQRVYDKSGLQRLFAHWRVKGKIYYILNSEGCYITASEEVAGQKDYLKGERALALLELAPVK
jgi:SAM-dependent methyltransferase